MSKLKGFTTQLSVNETLLRHAKKKQAKLLSL